MLNRKEKKDNDFDIRQASDEWVDINIIRNKSWDIYSVYAKRYAKIDWVSRGYMEISSNYARNLKQAKSVAEKLQDICLWYNPPEPWKEY